MRIKSYKTKMAVLLICALFMGTVAYTAYADSAIGSATVSAEILRVENVTFPLSATPDMWLALDFDVAYGNLLSSGDEVWVHMYSAGLLTPDLACSGKPSTLSTFNHYAAMWINSASERDGKGWDWDCDGVVAAKPYFQNPDAPTVRPITTNPTHLGFDIKFNQLADATNPWSIYIKVKYTDKTTGLTATTTKTYAFDLANFLQVNIVESTFNFGTTAQGSVLIPIKSPLNGALNIQVISNKIYRLQVCGTNPTFDVNSFSVANIYQNSVNDSASAVPLTLTAANVANMGDLPIGTNAHMLFLWIDTNRFDSVPDQHTSERPSWSLSIHANGHNLLVTVIR